MKRLMLMLMLVALLPLGGCWDRLEVEDAGYVVALGIDTAGEDDYLWTFGLGKSGKAQAAGEGAGAEEGQLQISVRAANLEQAFQVVQVAMSRVLSMHQLRFFILGEDLCRRGVGPLVNQFMRHNEVRRGGAITMVRGRAVDAMNVFKPSLDTNPIKVQEGLVMVQRRRHLSPPILFQHFYARLLSTAQDAILSAEAVNPEAEKPITAPLPSMAGPSRKPGDTPRHGGNPIELAGTAVFRGDRLAGILSIDETAALLALRGEMGKVYQTMPDPDQPGEYVALRFGQENKPRIRARLVNGRPVFRIHLQLEAELLSAPIGTDYTQTAARRRLEEYIDQVNQTKMYTPMMRKVYNEWGADPAGLGQFLRARFGTIDEWLRYDWRNHVRESDIQVTTATFIRRFGMILESPSGDGR